MIVPKRQYKHGENQYYEKKFIEDRILIEPADSFLDLEVQFLIFASLAFASFGKLLEHLFRLFGVQRSIILGVYLKT